MMAHAEKNELNWSNNPTFLDRDSLGLTHVSSFVAETGSKIYKEKELIEILNIHKPDIRINGSDWEDKKFTGCDLDIPHHFHRRNHSWSTTNIRERIYEEEKKLRNTK